VDKLRVESFETDAGMEERGTEHGESLPTRPTVFEGLPAVRLLGRHGDLYHRSVLLGTTSAQRAVPRDPQ
jgi:hypothetical protein